MILKKLDYKSFASANPDRVAGFVILVASMILSFLVWQFYPSQNSRNNTANKTQESCILSATNLCDSKLVELTGVVDSADITPELGYKFNPDSANVTNPIYITAVRYEGTKAYDGSEDSFYVPIPFGTKIKVRGTMFTREVAWCTQVDYAEAHPLNCQEGRSAIAISPISVISAVPVSGDLYSYFISGSISGNSNNIESCVSPVNFCEGGNGQNCRKVNIEKKSCSNLINKQNDLLISGYTKSLEETLNPLDITSVFSTSYSSASVDVGLENRAERYSNTDLGTINIFNHKGEQVTQISTGESQYYDLAQVIPTNSDIYYFVENTLYKNSDGQVSLIGKISSDLLEKPTTIYGNILAPDQKSIVTVLTKYISSQPLGSTNFMLTKNKHSLVRIWLNDSEDGILKHEVLFEKIIDGYASLSSFDFKSNKAVLSYRFDEEHADPCSKTHLYSIDVETNSETEIYSEVTDARKNCVEPVHRILSISEDGKTIISAYDFNGQITGPLPKKLVVSRIGENYELNRKEFFADPNLIGDGFNQNINFTVKDDNTLNIYNSWLPEIFYTFDTDQSDFTRSNLKPSLKGVNTLPPTADMRQPIFMYEDASNWYFWDREVVDYGLYSLSKNDKQLLLLSTFSATARFRKVGDKVYILDYARD